MQPGKHFSWKKRAYRSKVCAVHNMDWRGISVSSGGSWGEGAGRGIAFSLYLLLQFLY